jgi:Rad3-related DNA helicase
MIGRLIRSEDDRGIVVIVEGRADKGYFRRLREALPKGSQVVVSERGRLGELLAEVGISASEPPA